MIGTADLLRAVALSARAVAAVEIANNIGGASEEVQQDQPQPGATGPILADQFVQPQSPSTGQTLIGLSDPSVSFQSVAVQANGSVVETRIVDIVRQLSAQILMAEGGATTPSPQASGVPGSGPNAVQGSGAEADPAVAASFGNRDLEQIVLARAGASLMAGRTPAVDASGQSVAVDQRMGSTGDRQSGLATGAATIGDAHGAVAASDSGAIPVTAVAHSESGLADIGSKPSEQPLPTAANVNSSEAIAQAHDPSDMRLLAELLTGALTSQGVHGEAGGIIASFILNAAMIPGWPPPRLPETIEDQVADLATRLQVSPEMSAEDLMDYLAKFGVNEQLLERLRKAQLPPATTMKVLGYLAVLMTAISTIFASLKEEVAQLVAELKEQGAEEVDAESIRERLYLR